MSDIHVNFVIPLSLYGEWAKVYSDHRDDFDSWSLFCRAMIRRGIAQYIKEQRFRE